MQSPKQALKVLIVDDDLVAASVAAAALEKIGCDVELRTSPFGTGMHIQQMRPDVILLDVQMPGLAGDQLARMLKQVPEARQCRIVFYSSRKPEELAVLARQCGAVACISKSGDPAHLVANFRRVTESIRNRVGSGET